MGQSLELKTRMRSLVLLCALAGIALASEASFNEFAKTFNKKYASTEEFAKRREIFMFNRLPKDLLQIHGTGRIREPLLQSRTNNNVEAVLPLQLLLLLIPACGWPQTVSMMTFLSNI